MRNSLDAVQIQWYSEDHQTLIVTFPSYINWSDAHQASQYVLSTIQSSTEPPAIVLNFPEDFCWPVHGIAENMRAIFSEYRQVSIAVVVIVSSNPELWYSFVQMYGRGDTPHHYVQSIDEALLTLNIPGIDVSS